MFKFGSSTIPEAMALRRSLFFASPSWVMVQITSFWESPPNFICCPCLFSSVFCFLMFGRAEMLRWRRTFFQSQRRKNICSVAASAASRFRHLSNAANMVCSRRDMRQAKGKGKAKGPKGKAPPAGLAKGGQKPRAICFDLMHL